MFEQSGVIKPIAVESDNLFWQSIDMAAGFSNIKNADYMLYIDLSKTQQYNSYDAVLLKPIVNSWIANYDDTWTDEPWVKQKALEGLISNVIFNSRGKITVYITIQSVTKKNIGSIKCRCV